MMMVVMVRVATVVVAMSVLVMAMSVVVTVLLVASVGVMMTVGNKSMAAGW